MILITYICISIMYGSLNTAPPNDFFLGGSPSTDLETSEVQLSEEPNLQRRFNSNSNYNGMSTKFFPVIRKGNKFIYSKDLRNLHDQTENLEKNEISFHSKMRKPNNARRKSKTKGRPVKDNTENIINLFNKSAPSLEYFKKTFQISLDSKDDSPELSRTKNLEKWGEKNLSQRTRMKNKGRTFNTSSKNFLKRPYKSENRFIQKSKKRSSGLLSETSPLDTQNFHLNSKCQPLESLNLFQKGEFGKIFNSDAYTKCLLLHKDSKVELLIENKEVSSKFLGETINGNPFSVFKVMDTLPGTVLYETEVPDDGINISNNIKMPFEYLKNPDILNIETEDENFLPRNTNKLPVLKGTEKELESSNNDEDVENMFGSSNTIVGINNFAHVVPKIEPRINGKLPLDQMPIKQSFNENFPSIQLLNSTTVKDNQNFVQIENKETQSKIIFPINKTTSEKLLDASINNLKLIPISQLNKLFTAANSNNMKTPEKQIFGSEINNGPVIPNADFERTEFPNNQVKEEAFNYVKAPEKQAFGSGINNVPVIPYANLGSIEFPNNRVNGEALSYVKTTEKNIFENEMNNVPVLSSADFLRAKFPNKEAKKEHTGAKIIEDSYTLSQITSTNAGLPEFENKERQQNNNEISAQKPLSILPTLIYTNSLKPEMLDSITNATHTEQPANQSFTTNTGDIHIVITEQFVTQTIPEAITVNANTESDYNVKNPPVGISQNEEKPETDIKMLKMHYRHPHGTIEPKIRHRRLHQKSSHKNKQFRRDFIDF